MSTNRFLLFVATSLLALSLSCFIAVNWALWRQLSPPLSIANEVEYTYVGHDFPYSLPLREEFADTRVLLATEESLHYPLLGWQSDDAWRSLGYTSYGYVRLGESRRLFMVTMFHEMHCLRILNLAFDPSNIVGDGHIAHCLGYLRQQALCHVDLTLEPIGWMHREFESSDRQGATHVCRDWEAVYRAVEENWKFWNATRGATCDDFGLCVDTK